MAENARQEIELSFGGSAYKIRPDFETITAVELATDQASRTLGMKILRGEASVTELTAVVFTLVRGRFGAPRSAAEVGNIIVDDGYLSLIEPLGSLLTRAQRGNKEHEKEVSAAPAALDPPMRD
jgi:hypothetical protein